MSVERELYKQILTRKKCEANFLFFFKYFFQNIDRKQYYHNWHIDRIHDKLEQVRRYECTHLVINMPPRIGKTELVCNYWIAWCLMKNPSASFIHLSYNNRLAAKNSQKVKDILMSAEFQQLWPEIKVSKESKSKVEWEIQKYRGGMYAVSTEMGVTGYGAGHKNDGPLQKKFWGAVVIDDPVKVQKGDGTAEQINNYLNRINEIFNSTIVNRRENFKNTPIIINMQRVHENDLSGFVLNGLSAHAYEHLCLPVMDPDTGESLWEFMFPPEVIESLQSLPNFNGQYMQDPHPDEDDQMINLSWFPRYDKLPEQFEKIITSADTATKEKEINDPSVIMTFGLYNKKWYMLDVVRERMNFTKLKKKMNQVIDDYSPNAILIEDKSSGTQLIQELKSAGVSGVIAMTPTTDKVSRMNAQVETVETGYIVLPRRAPWLSDLEREFSHFPNVTHDDQVDALSQFLKRIKKKKKKTFVAGP